MLASWAGGMKRKWPWEIIPFVEIKGKSGFAGQTVEGSLESRWCLQELKELGPLSGHILIDSKLRQHYFISNLMQFILFSSAGHILYKQRSLKIRLYFARKLSIFRRICGLPSLFVQTWALSFAYI